MCLGVYWWVNANCCKLLAGYRRPQRTLRIVKSAAGTKRRRATLYWCAQHATNKHKKTSCATRVTQRRWFSLRALPHSDVLSQLRHMEVVRRFFSASVAVKKQANMWVHARNKHRNRNPCNQQPWPAQISHSFAHTHALALSFVRLLARSLAGWLAG